MSSPASIVLPRPTSSASRYRGEMSVRIFRTASRLVVVNLDTGRGDRGEVLIGASPREVGANEPRSRIVETPRLDPPISQEFCRISGAAAPSDNNVCLIYHHGTTALERNV